MKASEVRMLWVYARELWGATFQISDDATARQVKERVWLDVLGDLDVELVRRTMVGLDRHFAPTPPELRAAALERGATEAGEGSRHGHDEALAELHRLISRFGYTRPTEAVDSADAFDPALGAVVRAMGWLEICADENEAVFRGQFRQLYETAARRITMAQQIPAPALTREAVAELAS